MLTEGTTVLDTVIVIAFDVAVSGMAHNKEELIDTVTTSPLARVVD